MGFCRVVWPMGHGKNIDKSALYNPWFMGNCILSICCTTHDPWVINSVVQRCIAHGSWVIVTLYGPWVMGKKSLNSVIHVHMRSVSGRRIDRIPNAKYTTRRSPFEDIVHQLRSIHTPRKVNANSVNYILSKYNVV